MTITNIVKAEVKGKCIKIYVQIDPESITVFNFECQENLEKRLMKEIENITSLGKEK